MDIKIWNDGNRLLKISVCLINYCFTLTVTSEISFTSEEHSEEAKRQIQWFECSDDSMQNQICADKFLSVCETDFVQAMNVSMTAAAPGSVRADFSHLVCNQEFFLPSVQLVLMLEFERYSHLLNFRSNYELIGGQNQHCYDVVPQVVSVSKPKLAKCL